MILYPCEASLFNVYLVRNHASCENFKIRVEQATWINIFYIIHGKVVIEYVGERTLYYK